MVTLHDHNAVDFDVEDAETMLVSMSLKSPKITHVGYLDNAFGTPPPTPFPTKQKRLYNDMKDGGCEVGQSSKSVKVRKSFLPIQNKDNMPPLSLSKGSGVKKQKSERRVYFGQSIEIQWAKPFLNGTWSSSGDRFENRR